MPRPQCRACWMIAAAWAAVTLYLAADLALTISGAIAR
jgi:hypothetical protein